MVQYNYTKGRGNDMARDSEGYKIIGGWNPKQKTDAELVESCTKEIKRLESLLDARKKVLSKAEKRLEQASIEQAKQNLAERTLAKERE